MFLFVRYYFLIYIIFSCTSIEAAPQNKKCGYIRIIRALRTVDQRLVYWQSQQDQQWSRFFGTNVAEKNLELLHKKQHDLFDLLGCIADENVQLVKHDYLADVDCTVLPHHVIRHWMKYAAMLSVAGVVYSNRVAAQQLIASIMLYVANLCNKRKADSSFILPAGLQDGTTSGLFDFLNTLKKDGKLLPGEYEAIIAAHGNYNIAPFQNLFNRIAASYMLALAYAKHAVAILVPLAAVYTVIGVEKKIAHYAPPVFAGLVACYGARTLYYYATSQDYTVVRNLFADIAQLVIVEDVENNLVSYGKLIYYVHNLKEIAQKQLCAHDCAEFIRNLELLTSLDVTREKKWQLIENMRARYSFLQF